MSIANIPHALSVSLSNMTSSNGNIGIGTTTPAYPLDVVGNMRVSGLVTKQTYCTTYELVTSTIVCPGNTQTIIAFDTTPIPNIINPNPIPGLSYSSGKFTNTTSSTMNLIVSYALSLTVAISAFSVNSYIIYNNGSGGTAILASGQICPYGSNGNGTAIVPLASNAWFQIGVYVNNGGSVTMNIGGTNIQIALL